MGQDNSVPESVYKTNNPELNSNYNKEFFNVDNSNNVLSSSVQKLSNNSEPLNNSSTLMNSSKQINNTYKSNKKNLLEVNLIWNEGGREVFVTGSFLNWKQWYQLEKHKDFFCRKLLLSKENHYFKFIVDKEWKISKNYKTISFDNYKIETNNNNKLSNDTLENYGLINVLDLNHININNNNLILLSKINDSKKVVENKKLDQINLNKVINNENVLLKNNNFKKNSSYSDIKPDKSGLSSETPVLPCSYSVNFQINNMAYQKNKKNKDFLRCNSNAPYFINDYSHCNISSSSIGIPPHVNM